MILQAVKSFLKKYKTNLISALIIYLAILAFLFVAQRKLQYQPSQILYPVSFYQQNHQLLQGFEEINLFSERHQNSAEKLKILAWFAPAKNSSAQYSKKTVVYFHGNAGSLHDRSIILSKLNEAGFGVLAISYRGYQGSEGSPSEKGILQDADAAINFLRQKGIKNSDIILFGESLGSGVAVQIAAKYEQENSEKFAALFLESPYSSIVSVAQKQYWFVPVRLLLQDKFESEKFITKVHSPVFIIHGTADKVVNFSEGKRLFEFANEPKKFVEISGAGHLEFDEKYLVDQLAKFVSENN